MSRAQQVITQAVLKGALALGVQERLKQIAEEEKNVS